MLKHSQFGIFGPVQTESDTYEPTVQFTQVGSKSIIQIFERRPVPDSIVVCFSKKKMPAVPESLLKKRKANTEARAAAAKAAVLAKKVRMLWRRVEQPPSTVYVCNTWES